MKQIFSKISCDGCFLSFLGIKMYPVFVYFRTLEENIFPDESPNRNMHKTCLLLDYMLDCLHKCFMYDTHGFLDSDRFQCLMQPLVDQVMFA